MVKSRRQLIVSTMARTHIFQDSGHEPPPASVSIIQDGFTDGVGDVVGATVVVERELKEPLIFLIGRGLSRLSSRRVMMMFRF